MTRVSSAPQELITSWYPLPSIPSHLFCLSRIDYYLIISSNLLPSYIHVLPCASPYGHPHSPLTHNIDPCLHVLAVLTRRYGSTGMNVLANIDDFQEKLAMGMLPDALKGKEEIVLKYDKHGNVLQRDLYDYTGQRVFAPG